MSLRQSESSSEVFANTQRTTQNSIRIIKPYLWNGIWVFDDPAVGLVREAFVAGIDDIIDRWTEASGIQKPGRGFLCLFSDKPFPGHTLVLKHVRPDRHAEHPEQQVGNYYLCEQFGIEGWLCPALFRYFETAPPMLYGQAKPLPKRK